MDVNKKLISEVQKHKLLYDKSHPNFKENAMKSDRWKKLAAEVGIKDGNAARKQWTNLLKKYKLKKVQLPSGSAADDNSMDDSTKWEYLDDMHFMDIHLEERPQHSSSLANLVRKIDEEGDLDFDEDLENLLDSPALSGLDSPSLSGQSSARNSPVPSRGRKRKTVGMEETILNAIKAVNSSPTAEFSPLAQSVEDIYKRIKAIGKEGSGILLQFKKDIQKNLDDYEEWLIQHEK